MIFIIIIFSIFKIIELENLVITSTLSFWSYLTVQVHYFNEFISFLCHFYFFNHIHWFFSQVQRLMFVGVIFRSHSIVHVHWCEFHSVIFKPIFGHIELVKITSLFWWCLIKVLFDVPHSTLLSSLRKSLSQ